MQIKTNTRKMTEKIAVIGLGYVGLPLAVALARHFAVIGFDIDEKRITQLNAGQDRTAEVDKDTLQNSSLTITANSSDLKGQDIYIVTVPTPVDESNQPDLEAILSASNMVGELISPGAIVVFESTVYPGVTEDICGQAIAQASGLTCGQDFFLGYSPERMNPGDPVHTVYTITKVVAGQTKQVSKKLQAIYGHVTNGNIFVAKDIKTAEAAKVIENTQRDINVAFINEITMIFNKMGLSVHEVLEAAKTKWNFLPFTPGFVGGHCIGVDPYYLAKAAKDVGHDPEIILTGRRINNNMGKFIANQVSNLLQRQPANILVLGLTFKENVPDVRNTKVIDLVSRLQKLGHVVQVHDPCADPTEVKAIYGIDLITSWDAILAKPAVAVAGGTAIESSSGFDCIVGAVPHQVYTELDANILSQLVRPGGLIADVKAMWQPSQIPDNRQYWKL